MRLVLASEIFIQIKHKKKRTLSKPRLPLHLLVVGHRWGRHQFELFANGAVGLSMATSYKNKRTRTNTKIRNESAMRMELTTRTADSTLSARPTEPFTNSELFAAQEVSPRVESTRYCTQNKALRRVLSQSIVSSCNGDLDRTACAANRNAMRWEGRSCLLVVWSSAIVVVTTTGGLGEEEWLQGDRANKWCSTRLLQSMLKCWKVCICVWVS